MPSSVPTISTRPTGYWDRPHLQQSLPSATPSTQPTISLNPTSSPTEGLVINGREWNPCEEGQVVLVGVTVTLYSVLGQQIDQTVTDSEGRWEFTGLSQGRYFTVTDYPDCRRVLQDTDSSDSEDVNLSSSLSDEQNIKFFKNGNMCNSKVSLGDWDVFSTADWNEVALFDTLDECCANMFWHDTDGCLSRSRVAFQFEFCVGVSGLGELVGCPLQEIHIIENAMQTGLDKSSNLVLTEVGSIVLTNVNGNTKCSQSEYIHVSSHPQTTNIQAKISKTVCGTITTKETKCREEQCLKSAFKSISNRYKSFFDSGEFSSQLGSLAREASNSFPHLQSAKVVENSFVTKKLLLPLTVTSTPSVDGHDNDDKPLQYVAASSDKPRFHPTFVSGQLCDSKISFDSWEESYETLEECCKAHFLWDYDACCRSAGMGGC